MEQYGFELDLSAPIIKTLDAGVNYTYLDNNNRSSSDKLTDVPEHKFFVYAKYTPVKGLSLLADVEKDSKRWSDSRGVRVAKGYTVANIKAMYEIIRGLQIEAGVRNVFDNDYELNEGFPMPGRLFFQLDLQILGQVSSLNLITSHSQVASEATPSFSAALMFPGCSFSFQKCLP